jgi:VanZ family protein
VAGTVSARFRSIWLAFGWLWVAAILWLSLMPMPPQPLTFDYSDKFGHTLAYLFLMGWFAVVCRGRSRSAAAAWLATMGVLVEMLQGLSGYRYFEFADMVANSGGVLLAWLMMNRFGDALVARWCEPEKFAIERR